MPLDVESPAGFAVTAPTDRAAVPSTVDVASPEGEIITVPVTTVTPT